MKKLLLVLLIPLIVSCSNGGAAYRDWETNGLAIVIQLSTRGTVDSDNGICSWLKSQWSEATIRRIMAERL